MNAVKRLILFSDVNFFPTIGNKDNRNSKYKILSTGLEDGSRMSLRNVDTNLQVHHQNFFYTSWKGREGVKTG